MTENYLNQNTEAQEHQPPLIKPSKKSKGISYAQLGIIVLSFLIGVIAVLLFQNVTKSENMNFSTIGLMGFLFSILLAGASIVLAITAISLGKTSEQSMIDRSDESIRLQNEVFMRTTDALQRIESSTGVTEKRIEDMISGRASVISEKIVERAADGRLITRGSREELEEEIKKSILEGIETSPAMEEKALEIRDKKIKDRKEYEKFRDTMLLKITNLPGMNSIKIGDGHYNTEGDELVDGVFVFNNIRIGVSAHSIADSLKDVFLVGYPGYLKSISFELLKKTFGKMFMLVNEKISEDHPFLTQFIKCKEVLSKDIAEKLYLISGSPDEIIKELIDALKTKNTKD